MSSPAWQWDRVRQLHFFYSQDEQAWIYEDGTRVKAADTGHAQAANVPGTQL
jgi:hypothetical protein